MTFQDFSATLAPEYLNVLPHIWILYAFCLNGLFISQILCAYSTRYMLLVETFEARVLSGFFLSILLNGLCLLVLFSFGMDVVSMKFLLPLLTLLLLIFFARTLRRRESVPGGIIPEFGWVRLAVYSLVFALLCLNGGLIEQVADSWWHLSLANKVGIYNSFDVKNHLSGLPSRFYPPLWHGNLALLHTISGIFLPELWNSFTPWGGSFKVMGFYLFALGLSKDRRIAVLSAILFVLLPGLGDSYLRVSAWPAHISYTAWFCLFYVSFLLFDAFPISVPDADDNNLRRVLNNGIRFVRKSWVLVLAFVVLSVIIYFSHQAELLWYACAILFYAMALSFYRIFSPVKMHLLEPAWLLLRTYLLGGLLCIAVLVCLRYFPGLSESQGQSGHSLVPLLLLAIIGSFLYPFTGNSPLTGIYDQRAARALFLIVLAMVLLSIDLKHMLSLFNPEQGYPPPTHPQDALLVPGWLNEQLKLPNWQMQLRGGLLYTGILAVGISVCMAFGSPSRCTLFLAANALIPFVFLVSPYLYQGLSDLLQYKSPWRVALLIFHPVVWACLMMHAWEIMCSGSEDT